MMALVSMRRRTWVAWFFSVAFAAGGCPRGQSLPDAVAPHAVDARSAAGTEETAGSDSAPGDAPPAAALDSSPDAGGPDASDAPGPDIARPPADAPTGCRDHEECAGSGAACLLARCDLTTGRCGTAARPDGAPCDDGNACSVDDACLGGVCAGGAPRACDDGNPCTDELCEAATGCVVHVNLAACDDGDPCTAGDQCLGGDCLPGGPACEDADPCTADTCDPATGGCGHLPLDGVPCDDGDPCTLGDACAGAACIAGTGDGCDDGNPCTLDGCVARLAAACVHEPLDAVSCDDGDACTAGEACAAGACVGGAPVDCDDADPCTVDACDPVEGCDQVLTAGAPCDDGDVCTLDTTCDAASGACLPAAVLDCDDDNPCTKEICHPQNGCVYLVKTGPCDDGDACTTDDTCAGATCAGVIQSCDDGDACTADTCDAVLGCQHVDVSSTCDDADPCTDDACAPATGCVATPNGAPCDDGDLCTTDDHCAGGLCQGLAADCDDEVACTLDACDPELGCVHAASLGPCDDGDACTVGESCQVAGACEGGAPLEVDDGLACTLDGCDPGVGATYAPDDDLCGVGQICVPGQGCVTGDVRLLITKVLLWPEDAPPEDDVGQWLVLRNIGEVPVELADLALRDEAGLLAPLLPIEGSLVLEPGQARAGYEAAAPPSGFSFAFGSPGDGFVLGAGAIAVVDGAGVVLESLPLSPVALGPEVPTGALPVVPGAPTELGLAAVEAADDEADNDIAGQWCVSPEASAAPEAPNLACSRIRLNEVRLADAEGPRWVELHAPGGAHLDAALLQLVDAQGASLGFVSVPPGRAPIGARALLEHAVGDVTLPALTAGAVQLLRLGQQLDVYGFGALEAEVDATWGRPLYESVTGPPQVQGQAAERHPDGADTDDAAVDWQQVEGGSPGAPNAP